MRITHIKDSDIPQADPVAVVAQYEPYIRKLANRYTAILDRSGAVGLEDLQQVGRIAVLDSQKKYVPDGGASFISFITLPIKSAMRRALGFNSNTGTAPEQLFYLDEPISTEDSTTAWIDLVPDPSIRPFDEPLIEEETKTETANQVRAAVDRLRSEKQREVIQRVYFDGQERKTAADEMEMNYKTLCALDRAALSKLKRDYKLKKYVMPFYQVSINRFNITWTSATEAAVLWKERLIDELYGSGTFTGNRRTKE